MLQSIFTALQNKEIERNIVLRRSFVQFLEKRLCKPNGPRNISRFEFSINFKHNINSHYNIMLKNHLIYITVYGCVFNENKI